MEKIFAERQSRLARIAKVNNNAGVQQLHLGHIAEVMDCPNSIIAERSVTACARVPRLEVRVSSGGGFPE